MALESQRGDIGSWSPPDEGASALQWVLWAVFVQIVMLAGGWTCFKAVLPGLRFCVKFCSALIADSNEDLEWEATMQRSREMKDAKKRDNERREAERQAAKAIEREKRKRKMEIEQKKLDQDHQKFLSEKEAQVMSEKEQRKRLEKAKKEAGARAEREADLQRTKEWVTERKRREQEQLEKAEGLLDSNDRGKSPARGGKESSCATTPDSSASDRHVDELLSNDKEKPFKEEGRKDRRNRKGEHDGRGRDQTDGTPSSTRSEHHISVKEAAREDDEDHASKTKPKHDNSNGNSRRGGKKRAGDQRHNNGNNVQIELPAPRPPAPIAQPQQPISRVSSQQHQGPAVITAPVASMAQPWNADLDPPFNANKNGNHRRAWSLNADSDPEFLPNPSQPKQSTSHWSLNPEADPIVGAIGQSQPIGSIGRKVAPIGSIGQKTAPIGAAPIGRPIAGAKVGAAPSRW